MVVDTWRDNRVSLAAQEAYWKKQLGGALPVLELPLDYSRPPVQSFIRSRKVVELDGELGWEIKKFCARENVTPFIAMLAALKILLLRSTGQEDVIVGSISIDSLRDEDAPNQELFANPVALRTDLTGDPSVRELFARVATTVERAAENRDYAFERLVESISGVEELNRASIFQVMLILCDAPSCISDAPISKRRLAEIEEYTSKLDLAIIAYEEEGVLRIACEYDSELFEPASITGLLGHFQTLLEGVVVNPLQRLSTLPILTEAERDQQILKLQDIQGDYPPDASIHQWFEAQMERAPEAVAVVFENERITYRELNRRANQLAHHLQALGVGPGVLVGICMERSLEMVVGILGILKAGGAYAPLDLAYPKERLAFILEDARAPVLLTQERLLETLPGHGAHVICLDRDWNNIAQENDGNPCANVTPDNIAYVIYTSGSTGLPKGVLVTHSNVSRLFVTTQPWYQFDDKDVWTLFHSYAFDFSVWEIWGALLYGGRLVVVPYWVSRSPDAFYELLCAEQVTVLNQTPSAFRHLIQAEERASATREQALRLVIFGGEALELQSLRPWFERHGDQSPQLVNMYGITETTVHVTCRPLTMEDLNGTSGSVIGGPIPDLRVFALDKNSQLAPFRVPGELHISGAGLARGYLNQPELTALKFVPDPFSDEPGARLYKSGDLARLLPDGDIEFVGRLDHQVKIRGFRIELGEIEAALGGHPAIRETVVLAQEERPGEKRLVAYLVANQNTDLSISELRDFVGEKLPDYMTPSVFVTLDALPLTPNGKVDRKALPQPEWTRPELESAFKAPRTATEEMLAGIWTDVLGLDRVGVHDNFFELGGHSLLAIQVISRVREAFQVELALRDLFETPTISGLAERIETAIRADQGLPPAPIARVARGGNLPLSFGQQRLWFLNQLAQGSSFYNISFAIRVGGNLDMAALEWSLNEIARRHEVMRTTFSSVDGQPVQIISDTVSLTAPLIDLTELSEGHREAEAQRLASEMFRIPFNLTDGPLFHGALLRFTAEDHVFLFAMHHIISDGWSMGVLIREFVTLYHAFIEGRPSPLSDLPIQYVDFASWQREWLQGEALEKQLSYWKKQLDGCPPVLELPTDRPRPSIQTFRGANLSMALPKDLSEAVQNLSRQEGVTLFMTLLAAFQTLLHRYSGQDDINVGSAIAGRTHMETEGMIGFFVNTLIFRTDLGGDPSFREVLRQVRDVMLGAYAHKDLPFERLVEALQPARSMSHSPLFQVAFDVQNLPTQALQLPGLDIRPFKVEGSTSKYDLHLFVMEGEDGLTAKAEYSVDLFDASTIRRMLRHFITLLGSIVAAPERRISALPLMTESETDQLLVEWNQTQVAYPAEKRLHRLFEAQAKRTPDAVALVFEEEQITYRELNERANQLAHHLKKQGIGAEALVGVCLERSLEMVVAILGVLKAGGAYVPLDPAYPPERLGFMLEDSHAHALLTQQRLVESLIEDRGAKIENSGPRSLILDPKLKVLFLDTLGQRLARESAENPTSDVEAEHPAYVIYTSGSTGRPKGVIISHQAIANHMLWLQEYFSLNEEDCALQKTPFSFDASVTEFFAPLLTGGRLIMALPGGHQDGAYLVRTIAHYGVTCLQLVPSLLRVLLDEPGFGRCQSLRRVICAGEALPAELQDRFTATVGAELHNFYGPTEAAIDATFWRCDHSIPRPVVPIGRPLANTQIYLLGADLQPAPVGAPGALHIGGANLARGYLNRPELTAERFIPNPFSQQPGARLYRTGDLASYLPDGAIEFLGRSDHQVKARGARIELGEVEAALSRHPAVREAVVVARPETEDVAGDIRLVAYLVSDQRPAPTAGALRAFLKERAPEYMIPSAFVTLDALPLTPNGKVDRRALPSPEKGRPDLESVFVAPRNMVEELLAETWARVLGAKRVGVYDNFFSLGGHSLLAMKLIARVREVFRVELPLRDLFEMPTVAQLAAAIAGVTNPGPEIPPILSIPRDQELPLSFSQQRLWFLDQLEPGSSFYNVSAPARLTGKLNISALRQSITEIIRRHEVLRTVYRTVDGRPVQVVSNSFTFTLPAVDLRGIPEEEREAAVSHLATEDSLRPFDLAEGPLFRAALLQFGDEDHVLLFTTHHIISDIWSRGVLMREVAVLYQSFAEGKDSPLRDLPVQYADFAHWQRRWMQGEVLDAQLSYWKRQLAGSPSVLELPTDRPRPAVQSFRGADLAMALPEGLSRAVVDLSRREGVTLFMTLLAAFQTLLFRYTGEEIVNVGSPIAGRTRPETEGMIGFFLNTLVFRADFSSDPSFRELLRQVRETSLEAYSNQDLPFEQLVEALQAERNMSHSPLFQVAFVTLNFPMETVEIPGLKMRPLRAEGNTAKYDLTLSVIEGRDGLAANVEYRADLFEGSTIARMLEHFFVLVEGLIANPDQRVSSLPLMTEAERNRLLSEWNDTVSEYPRDKCAHELFEAQVERSPDAIALAVEEEQLTYRELNRRANQLAAYLGKLGVGPETPVGFCLESSPEMVVGVLGISKAGGTYVPLDPAYPRERLAFMLEDTRTLVLLVQQRLIEHLPEHQARVVQIDADWELIARESEANPEAGATADHLAYVMYTSGSTGGPKGISIPHRAINRLVFNTNYIEITPDDRMAMASNSAFDASTFELWGALLHGARLVGISRDVALSPPDLAAEIRAQGISVMFLTTALFNQLAREVPAAFGSLRSLLFGGEAVDLNPVKAVLKHNPPARLLHVYGPTESTTFTTWYPEQAAPEDAITVPIGRPLANTEVYLLDRNLQPAPVGVGGELYIGGDGLARGYFNQPELTAEKFIPNPFSGKGGGRLYKTGDLARYWPTGDIEFLGRLDHQVKIRGFRIELGEIEAVLTQHPAVREAAVLAGEDAAGEKRLVAYVAPDPGGAPTGVELRSYLRQKLPEYMTPSVFVELDALPLTPNGKVDRRALPAPEKARPDLESAFVAPRNPIEEKLAEIAAQILRIEKPGIHDNFFDLGGHSLLATQFISRVRNDFQVELPLRSVFTGPTIAEFAEAIEKAREDGLEPRAPAMKAIPRETRRVKAATLSK